jgi:4-hydroxy-2-oxoheptanedioate aldolase
MRNADNAMLTRPRLNKLIRKLEAGVPVFGTMIANGSYEQIIAVAESEFDFIILDMEHWNFDFPMLRHSLQYLLNRRRIAEKGGVQPDVVPLVRVPPAAEEMSPWIIKQVLDLGAYGIVVPHVASVEDARAVLAAMRYPRPQRPLVPEGRRGWHAELAARYWGVSEREYYEAADVWPLNPDGELFFVAFIESQEGLEQLPDILVNVKGIGAVFVGMGDMSVSLGHGGEMDHPEVERAAARVLEICTAHGVPCMGAARTGNVDQRLAQGYRILMFYNETGKPG